MIAGVALLLVLGSWQAMRFSEKLALETERDGRLTSEATPISSATVIGPEDDFTRRVVIGYLDLERTVLFKFRNYESKPGYWLGTPLIFGDGSALLVNRGWVPMETGRELARELGPRESVELEGVLRIPDQIISDDETRASMKNDALKGSYTEWSSFDVTGVYNALPYEVPEGPAVLVLDKPESDREYPIASAEHITKPYLTSEKHLGYALTWYTLAICLFALWVAAGFGWVSSRPRGGKRADETAQS